MVKTEGINFPGTLGYEKPKDWENTEKE